MKKALTLLLFSLLATCVFATPDLCPEISIYVDAAPNVYGSPDYAPWEQATFSAVANGTFVNMGNGVNSANIGTTNFEIQDEVVYSFGDKGLRLTWIYFIEGETVDSALDKGLQVSLINDWDGDVVDFYNDQYGSTWLTPTKIYNYDDGTVSGVIGVAGMAWWGGYTTDTQEELDADIYEWMQANESWTFSVKLNCTDESIVCNREAIAVPAPGAVLLAGFGASLIRRFRRA